MRIVWTVCAYHMKVHSHCACPHQSLSSPPWPNWVQEEGCRRQWDPLHIKRCFWHALIDVYTCIADVDDVSIYLYSIHACMHIYFVCKSSGSMNQTRQLQFVYIHVRAFYSHGTMHATSSVHGRFSDITKRWKQFHERTLHATWRWRLDGDNEHSIIAYISRTLHGSRK